MSNNPKAIKVIGWLFLLLGVLMTISGSGWFILLITNQDHLIKYITDYENYFLAIFGSLLALFSLISMYLVPIAITMVIAGMRFLNRRRWARVYLEVLTWGNLFIVILGLVFSSVYFFLEYSPSSNSYFDQSGKAMGVAFAITAGIAMTIIVVVTDIIILKHLRSATVRNAMIH